MERTPIDTDTLHTEGAHLSETASGWNLTDHAFIDELVEQEGLYRVKYDPARATPSFAVITVVSKITERDPLELDPISESIDGDALNALCTADSSSGFRLTFPYCGCEITIRADDVFEVVPR